MTQTTFTDNVLIDGSQDIEQLRVQGHTTQTDPLQTWENSAAGVLAQVTGDGRLTVGDDLGLATPDSLVEVHRDSGSTAKPKRGFHSLGRITDTLNAVVAWAVAELELLGTAGISALHSALRVKLTNSNNGTMTSGADLRAGDFEVVNSGGESPVTKLTAVQAVVTNNSGAAVTDAVGVKVTINNSGTITNPYAIHTDPGGIVHLGDTLELQRPAAVPGTPATDLIRVYPKTDGKLYAKNWSGVEYDLTASGGSGAAGANILGNSSFEVWENGTSSPPDNWVLTGSGAAVAREDTLVKHGNYSAKLTRSGADCHLSFDVYTNGGKTYMRSRQYTFGAWVYATAANRVRLRVHDGTTTTYSGYHTGDSTWQYLTATFTVEASATAVNVGLAVDTGDTSGYIDGAMLVEGGSASGYQPRIPEFNQFPARVTLLHDEALITAGNALLAAADTAQMYCAIPRQNPPANGNTFTHSFFLAKGSYTFSVLGKTQNDRGRLDWYIDDVLVASAQDWYSAVSTVNVVKTANVTLDVDGYHVLKGVINGKNASSSGYYMTLTKYWFAPSAD